VTSSQARLFIGLALGRELGERVGAAAAAALGARDFRLARPEGLHLTLYFLGDTERARIQALSELLRDAHRDLRAPALRLRQGGAFPRLERPRVPWVGVEERAEGVELAACHRAVLAALERFGLDTSAERERPFRPHVTVARSRGGRARVSAAFRELDLRLDWDPPALTLFESCPAPGGSRYEACATFSFPARG
jgi:2'-5' RNA ligase